MTDYNAIIIEVGGKSYIRVNRVGYHHSYSEEGIAANGIAKLPRAPGDDSFLLYDGAPVERLELIIPPRRITTKYVLREDLRGSPKAEVISVDQHRALSEADQSLYRTVYEDIPQTAEPIPFVTSHENGEPSKLPKGIVATDKNYFARFPGFWHLGAVRATAKYVLWRLAKRVAEAAKSNPLIQLSTGWHDVDAIMRETHRDTFFFEISPLVVNGVEVTAKNRKTMFTTDPKDRHLNYGVVVPAIDGDNLPDLEAKVSAYVEQTIGIPAMSWVKPSRCPCCDREFDRKSSAIRRVVKSRRAA